MSAEIIHGDCLDVLNGMPNASVDAVIEIARQRIADAQSQLTLEVA